jgi:hypothetical protein
MNSEPTPKPKFWARQFNSEVTRAQTIFDLVFGIIAPVLVLIFDPFVFRNSGDMLIQSPLAHLSVFAYVGISIGILILSIWLIGYQRIQQGHGFFVGVLGVGAVFSLLVGIVLLPYSLFGLLIGLGILGFIPFLTAFVYYRNAARAHQWAMHNQPLNKIAFSALLILGLILTLVLPSVLQWQTTRYVSQSVDAILHGSPQVAEQGITDLKRAFWCSGYCYDAMVTEYIEETNQARRTFLEHAYQKLTGKSIIRRAEMFED